MELERRSSGVAKAGLATGIVGTSLGTLGVLGALGNGAGALFGRQQPNDQKSLEMYKYVDGRFREFEQAFAAQAVNNQKTADDVARVQANLDCCCRN